jgi:HAE1 family hydrophobic/amphiphilic exporter-1
MSIAKTVVKRPVLWIVVFALVCMSALFLVSDIPFDMFPEIEAPYITVYTTYPGANPETIEKSVTNLLESALANTGGINEMQSQSREQVSIITMEFEFGTDMNEKMNLVRENIDQISASLPDNANKPRIILQNINDRPVMRIAVRGDNITRNELRAFARKNLVDGLQQVDGVASCDVEGGQDAIVQVSLSQNRLEAYGVTISEIAKVLAAQNFQLGAGYIAEGQVEYSIKTSGEYASIADVANTVIIGIGGADIRLCDIAEVTMDYSEERSTAYINGEPGVYLSIMKQGGANTVKVADEIYKRIEGIQKTLPENINLEIIQDSTVQIRNMIEELFNSAVLGVGLAMIVLFLFFRNINSSVIVGLSIPISFLITLLAMNLAGITINMMTLAGLILGLGMIVDSSIVVLESTAKFREKGEKPTIAAVLAGEEVMSSIIASAITTICVFLPILLFKNQLGMIGILAQDMLFTIGFSLTSSLLVAIFLVPVLASKWLLVHSRLQKPLRNPVLLSIDNIVAYGIDVVTQAYRRLLVKTLEHRLVTIVLVIAAFTGSVLALIKFDIKMFPKMNSDTISLDIEMPLGTKYEETKAAALQMQEFAIAEITGVKNITSRAGGGMTLRNNKNNTARITIILDSDDPGANSSDEVKEKLRSNFSSFPNATLTFSEGEGVMALLMSSSSPIDIILYADDINQAFADAGTIKTLLEERVPEVQDIAVDVNAGLPQVSVNIDRQRAYNMGLNIASIAAEIAAAMNGVTATTFKTPEDEYDIELRLANEDRHELLDLGKIFIRSSKGMLYPVSNFANLEKTQGLESINHENQVRVIHVTAGIKEGEQLRSTQTKIKSLLDDQGFTVSFAGEFEDTSEMLKTFVPIIILALFLVFGVMAAQYESFRDPFINFCTIPLIVIGVVAIHLITGQGINAFTMFGFVMLAGIVVNNGILLVDYTNLLIHKKIPVMEACIEAGSSRFRPVLMTTLTTMLGLAPMAFFPGKSSQMTAPIGLAVFGGLASATVITLFFIPVMYSLLHKNKTEKNDEN